MLERSIGTLGKCGTLGLSLALLVMSIAKAMVLSCTGRRDNLPRRADVELSGNFQLTLEGTAYPTYYKGLFSDLRSAFTAAVEHARGANLRSGGKTGRNLGFRHDRL